MQFRFAQPNEVDEVARLVAHSFVGRSLDVWSEQLRDPPQGGGTESLLVGLEQDRLVASLQLLPLRQWIGGTALPMAGVGTVTVAPTHRQRGVAAALMTFALRAALERGDVASALYPFRFSFYAKFGYGTAGEALQYLVPPAALPPSDERKRVERLDRPEQRAEALELYNQWMRGQNGQIERSARMWARQFSSADVALTGYRNARGELEGYALVVYRADLPVNDRYLEVNELVWMTPAARSGLLGWLASLDDQWQLVLLRALPSHQLGEALREPVLPRGAAPAWGLWTPSAVRLVGPMFRLLDVSAAWNIRRVADTAALSVALQVADEQISENSGDWLLRLENGRARIERGAGAAATMRMTIATLSRLYIGALAPSVAHAAGLLECDRPEILSALDTALALPEPWLFERF